MFNQKNQIHSLLKIFAIAIAINGTMGSLIPTHAEQTQPKNNQESVAVETVNNGLPSHRRDGGTRSGCAVNTQGFVALIPETGINRTASVQPKLYFNVPETKQTQTIEFVLRDQNDQLVYEKLIKTQGQSGIMSVDIPLSNQQKSLASGIKYRWYLSNICNPQKRSQDIVLEGSIEHQAINEATQIKLATLSVSEQIKFHQQQGNWYDSLAIAATELETKQSNLENSQWSNLLKNIGLEEFVDQPLIN